MAHFENLSFVAEVTFNNESKAIQSWVNLFKKLEDWLLQIRLVKKRVTVT